MTHRQPVDQRQSFAFELGHLVRAVRRRDGDTYCHRCSLESYRAVAHFIEENAGQGVTTNMLWEAVPDVPCTQTSVAVASMKERSCLSVRQRRMFPTSDFFFEDAMIELHAMQHKGPESNAPTHLDYADEAESAQRAGAWPQAAALWRRAAEMCDDASKRERYAKHAAWCDEMAARGDEAGEQP